MKHALYFGIGVTTIIDLGATLHNYIFPLQLYYIILYNYKLTWQSVANALGGGNNLLVTNRFRTKVAGEDWELMIDDDKICKDSSTVVHFERFW